MRNFKTEGIVIHKRNLGETDYVITILTPIFGKLEVHAKGARRVKSKFTGHLDLLNICNFQIYKSPKNYIVTECQLHKNYSIFWENLKQFHLGSEIVKILKYVSQENENCEDMYELVIETFNALVKYRKSNLIFEAFKIKLLNLLGFMPDFSTIDENEFKEIEFRMKKLIKYLSDRSFKDINLIALTQKEENSLQNTTNSLFAYSW